MTSRLRLVNVQTQLARGTALVTLTAELRDTRTDGAPAAVTPRRRRCRAARAAQPAVFEARDARARRAAPDQRRACIVTRPALWRPAAPRSTTSLLAAGTVTLRHQVGLRELRRSGRRLLLNGRTLRIAGAGLPMDAEGHGDALTGADQDRIVDELRAIGANATRSQHPLSDELLSRLDAAGILVWQHVGPFDKAGRFWAQTPQRRATAMARAVAAAERTAAHPSVFAFNLANEVAGRGHPKGQARYIDTLARHAAPPHARRLRRRGRLGPPPAAARGRAPVSQPRRRRSDGVHRDLRSRRAAGGRARAARREAPAARTCGAARQAARHHGVRRERQRAQQHRPPRRLSLPVAAARRAASGSTRAAPTSPARSSGSCASTP